jgi:hypothetical protein
MARVDYSERIGLASDTLRKFQPFSQATTTLIGCSHEYISKWRQAPRVNEVAKQLIVTVKLENERLEMITLLIKNIFVFIHVDHMDFCKPSRSKEIQDFLDAKIKAAETVLTNQPNLHHLMVKHDVLTEDTFHMLKDKMKVIQAED